MLREHQRFFNLIFQFFDLFIVAIAWLLSYPFRFIYIKGFIPVTKGYPLYDHYAYLTFGIITIWYLVFSFSGVYKARRSQSMLPEIFAIIKASAVAFLMLVAGAFLITGDLYSRGVLLVFFALSTTLLICERVFLRLLLRGLRRRGFNQRNMLIVGDNEVAAAFLERLRFHPELGLQVRGVLRLDEFNDDLTPPPYSTGLPILGTTTNIAEVISAHSIDQVILALRNSQKNRLDEVLSEIVELGVDVRIIPDLHQYITLGCEVEEFEGLPLISLNQSPIVGWSRVAKRASDIVIASLALVIFSPLMFLIYTAIKVLTPGPAVLRQERMGLDGYLFTMYKFRTMVIDAEEKTGAVWTKKNDSRVTWLGRFLRPTSLDELPQLFNVLKGDMSCVGPRPERPSLVEKFRLDIPKYMLRHKVKAGMTGWAQVNGWRGDTSLEKRIEYDLYYISNWSLFFDLKIMIMTLFRVSKNAY